MATVSALAVGGKLQIVEANTVAEVKQKLGLPSYTASINGEPAADDQKLQDNEFVSLAPAVKGA